MTSVTLTLDQGIRYIVLDHSSTSTYIPNFVQSGKHLWMDGETPRPATLGCDVYEVTEIMVDNAGIGQMTSPNEDQWSGYSSGRSWSLERDTMRCQPFLWRKALNDDNIRLTQRSLKTSHVLWWQLLTRKPIYSCSSWIDWPQTTVHDKTTSCRDKYNIDNQHCYLSWHGSLGFNCFTIYLVRPCLLGIVNHVRLLERYKAEASRPAHYML